MFEAEMIFAVRDFVERGGNVMFAIALLTAFLWGLIVERMMYYSRGYRSDRKHVEQEWKRRGERNSWNADKIRMMMVSQLKLKLHSRLGLINTIVALCPMFGLLGTVTGMIEVFDVMASAGSGNARGMASGVSKATLPTMAGMVAAISGMLFSVQLERFASSESESLADNLQTGQE